MFKRFSTVCMWWVLTTIVGCMIFSMMAQQTDTADPSWADVLTGFSIMWSVIGLPVAVLWIAVGVSRYIFAHSKKNAQTIQRDNSSRPISEGLETKLSDMEKNRREREGDQD
jgi:type VI protein secretion system component VasK